MCNTWSGRSPLINESSGCNVAWTRLHGCLVALAATGGLHDESGITSAGEAASALPRVPYQDRLDIRTESCFFHSTKLS